MTTLTQVVGMLVVAVVVLVAPLYVGRSLERRRHAETLVRYLPRDDGDVHDEAETMVGYVASEREVFFLNDPLNSHSLPTALAHHELADAVTVALINEGVLPSRTAWVDAAWVPWGYELPESERRETRELVAA